MATLAELIYDVRETLRLYTDDSEISDRFITYLYANKRAKYLRQDANNFQRTKDISITQTLCLELEVVPANECQFDIDCSTILRTKRPLPTPIEGHVKTLITSVKPTNRIAYPFTFTTKEKAIYFKHSPHPNSIYAFLDNDMHIYVVSNLNTIDLMECLTITGVFQDPLDLLTYTNCCKCEAPKACFDVLETEYPIQPHWVDVIKSEIVKELYVTIQQNEDKENDANTDEEQAKRG